ncbi:MAG: MMPL family transporter, partial [Candidatus Andersenbacteria bacterium]
MPEMFERLFALVERYPRQIVAGVLSLTVVLGALLVVRTDVATKTSDLFYPKYIEPFTYATQELPDPATVHVTVQAPEGYSLLDPALIREQDQLFTEIQRRWPVNVESLTTVLNRRLSSTRRNGAALHVGSLSDPDLIQRLVYDLWRTDPYEFERFARKGLSDPEAIDTLGIVGYFNSLGAGVLGTSPVAIPKISAVRATIVPREPMDEAATTKVLAAIRDYARSAQQHLTVRLYSAGLVVNEADHRVKTNSLLVTALMVALLALLLWRASRSWFFVWMPLLVLGVMLVWSYGLASLTWSRTFTFLAVVPIPLLLGQTIDNLIHLSERYREEASQHTRREAARTVFVTAGAAAALTTLINVAAFVADMVTSNLRPIREYTYLLVLGIAAAFVLTYLLGGALLVLHGRRASEHPSTVRATPEQGAGRGSHEREFYWGQRVYWWLRRRRVLVAVTALLLLAGACFMITRIDRNHRPTTYMARDFPTYGAYQFEQQHFSVFEPHYVVIHGDILNPRADELVQALEAKLDSFQDVEHIQGKVNVESLRYFTGLFLPESIPTDRSAFFDQVKSSDLVVNRVLGTTARELFGRLVHQNPQPEEGQPRYDATVVKFWPKLSDSKRIKEMYSELEATAAPFLPDYHVQVAGEFLALSLTLNDSMNSATVASIVTGVFIIVLLSILYRSLVTGLITSLPTIFGAAIGMGVLPVLGIELTPLNATVAVLAVGLGIDYSIQIMARYREELAHQIVERPRHKPTAD